MAMTSQQGAKDGKKTNNEVDEDFLSAQEEESARTQSKDDKSDSDEESSEDEDDSSDEKVSFTFSFF